MAVLFDLAQQNHKHTGAVDDSPQIDSTGLADNSVTDAKIGNRIIDSKSKTLTAWLQWLYDNSSSSNAIQFKGDLPNASNSVYTYEEIRALDDGVYYVNGDSQASALRLSNYNVFGNGLLQVKTFEDTYGSVYANLIYTELGTYGQTTVHCTQLESSATGYLPITVWSPFTAEFANGYLDGGGIDNALKGKADITKALQYRGTLTQHTYASDLFALEDGIYSINDVSTVFNFMTNSGYGELEVVHAEYDSGAIVVAKLYDPINGEMWITTCDYGSVATDLVWTFSNQTLQDTTNALFIGKVDKVAGKGLSTNDYDNTEKGKVASAEQTANKGQANGYASLDANSLLVQTAKLFNGNINKYSEKLTAVSPSGSSLAIDLSQGNIFSATLSTSVTISFTNIPTGTVVTSVTAFITYNSGASITFPASVKWNYGSVPTFTVGKVYKLVFQTIDNGTSWYVNLGGAY